MEDFLGKWWIRPLNLRVRYAGFSCLIFFFFFKKCVFLVNNIHLTQLPHRKNSNSNNYRLSTWTFRFKVRSYIIYSCSRTLARILWLLFFLLNWLVQFVRYNLVLYQPFEGNIFNVLKNALIVNTFSILFYVTICNLA